MPSQDPAKIAAVLENIAQRRSLGLAKLTEDPVPIPIIEQALEAANWAPSHGDTEPWRFTVITGDSRIELGKAYAEAYKQDAGDNFKQETFDSNLERGTWAPLWISIGMTPGLLPDGTPKMPEIEEMMAVACAVQNLHLAFAAHGLVGMWHSKGVSIHPHVAEYLGLTPPSKLLGFFFCGYPAVEWPEGERTPWQDKVTYQN